MKDLLARFSSWLDHEDGTGAFEYGLIVAGIVLAVLTAIYAIGGNINNKFSSVQKPLSSSDGGGGPGKPHPAKPEK